ATARTSFAIDSSRAFAAIALSVSCTPPMPGRNLTLTTRHDAGSIAPRGSGGDDASGASYGTATRSLLVRWVLRVSAGLRGRARTRRPADTRKSPGRRHPVL